MSCIKLSLPNGKILKLCSAIVVAVLLSACGSTSTRAPRSEGRVNLNVNPINVPDAAKQEYQLALSAVDNKDWANAELQLLKMQGAYPALSSVNTMLAWVYWQGEKPVKATRILEEVIKTPLYKSDAFNYLAIIYREQGKFGEAEALYQQAIKIWPQDPILHKNLGILYDLYLDRLPDALSHYQQALALNGRDKQLKGWVKDLERRSKK